MLDVLHGVAETVRSVLVLGHNPGMHELAMTLVGANGFSQASLADSPMLHQLAEGYPTGALCEFTIAGAWASVGEGSGRLQHFLCPRDLPETAG